MKKKILLDIDGVVLNLLEGLKKNLANKGITYIPENMETYNFKGDIGCTRNEALSGLDDLATFELAPFYDGAKEAVKKLRQKYDVYAYTRVPSLISIINNRHDLIADLGLNSLVFINRKPILGGYYALIEDCPYVLEEWAKAQSKTKLFMVRHSYNKDLEIKNMVVRDSLLEIADILVKN